jgi:hypothetical protein
MKMHVAWLSLPLLFAANVALAQFSSLRFDDDLDIQHQACIDNRRDSKCSKYRLIGQDVRLKLGGDLRWRYEYANNPRYGLEPQDSRGVLMGRGSVFADLWLGEHWRGFAQLSSSITQGRAAGPSPVDENRLDPTNLFIEWYVKDSFGMRVGIQELQFGSGRIIDVREGPNVRRSFDAVRAYATAGVWRIDTFAGAPRLNRQGIFDDARSSTQALRGIYITREGHPSSWDFYLLHYEDTHARYLERLGHERRWTLGTRYFGASQGWAWNSELLVQGGRFGDDKIRAWSLANDMSYTFYALPTRPKAALLFAVASGDKDPSDGRLGTINPFYPRGNYFGDEATLGPRNFFNVHPALTWQPRPPVQITAGIDFFWRYSLSDGVYAPSGLLIRGPGNSQARYVATIASLGATWNLAQGWTSTAVAAYARPGAFLRETGANQALGFVSLSAQYRF